MEENNIDQEVRLSRHHNVRRRLFQDDRDDNTRKRENAERISEEAQQRREESKLKWNFDFDKGIPLPGPYEWVKIDEDFDDNPNSVLRDSTNIPNPQGQAEEEESSARNVTETE